MGHFTTPCNRCGEEILLSNENDEDRWRPYDYDEVFDGTDTEYLDYHKCIPEDFETVCKFCDADIQMSKQTGRWLPYDDADSAERHRCLGSGKGKGVEKGKLGGQLK